MFGTEIVGKLLYIKITSWDYKNFNLVTDTRHGIEIDNLAH